MLLSVAAEMALEAEVSTRATAAACTDDLPARSYVVDVGLPLSSSMPLLTGVVPVASTSLLLPVGGASAGEDVARDVGRPRDQSESGPRASGVGQARGPGADWWWPKSWPWFGAGMRVVKMARQTNRTNIHTYIHTYIHPNPHSSGPFGESSGLKIFFLKLKFRKKFFFLTT